MSPSLSSMRAAIILTPSRNPRMRFSDAVMRSGYLWGCGALSKKFILDCAAYRLVWQSVQSINFSFGTTNLLPIFGVCGFKHGKSTRVPPLSRCVPLQSALRAQLILRNVWDDWVASETEPFLTACFHVAVPFPYSPNSSAKMLLTFSAPAALRWSVSIKSLGPNKSGAWLKST